MSQQLIQRIAHWLANEVITKRLANSATFINLAHKTHSNVQKAGKAAAEVSTVQRLQNLAKTVLADEPNKPSALGKMYKRQ